MKLMSPMDSMFLIGETREHPMHVGGLQVFTPPAGAGPEFIPEIYEALRLAVAFSVRVSIRPAAMAILRQMAPAI